MAAVAQACDRKAHASLEEDSEYSGNVDGMEFRKTSNPACGRVTKAVHSARGSGVDGLRVSFGWEVQGVVGLGSREWRGVVGVGSRDLGVKDGVWGFQVSFDRPVAICNVNL